MNVLQSQLLEILIELKQSCGVIGVKSEFEAEGAGLEETFLLKHLADEAGLDLTVKIAGCEAIRDLEDIKNIKVDNIVAPMIESPYALQKFVKAVFNVYENKIPDLYINIETKTGMENFDNILSRDEFADIKGVVFGRTDMCASLGISYKEINSDVILNNAKIIFDKLPKNKELIIGGRINSLSLVFLKSLLGQFSKFETRKIIFDAKKAFSVNNIENSINKALKFELLWLKNKKSLTHTDTERLEFLENQFNFEKSNPL